MLLMGLYFAIGGILGFGAFLLNRGFFSKTDAWAKYRSTGEVEHSDIHPGQVLFAWPIFVALLVMIAVVATTAHVYTNYLSKVDFIAPLDSLRSKLIK